MSQLRYSLQIRNRRKSLKWRVARSYEAMPDQPWAPEGAACTNGPTATYAWVERVMRKLKEQNPRLDVRIVEMPGNFVADET